MRNMTTKIIVMNSDKIPSCVQLGCVCVCVCVCVCMDMTESERGREGARAISCECILRMPEK